MALTLKLLYVGVLSGSETAIYPVGSPPASSPKSALIKNIILTNTHTTSAATVNIKVQEKNTSATARMVSPPGLRIPPRGQVILDVQLTLLLLNPTDGPNQLRASATGGTVECVVNGMERDV